MLGPQERQRLGRPGRRPWAERQTDHGGWGESAAEPLPALDWDGMPARRVSSTSAYQAIADPPPRQERQRRERIKHLPPQPRPKQRPEPSGFEPAAERETEQRQRGEAVKNLAPFSDRTRLAPQYRRGADLDDDTDLGKSFGLRRYALGSLRNQHGHGERFMSGFSADTGNARVSFNNDRRWIYVHAEPDDHNAPPVFIPLEVEIPYEDIVTKGIRVVHARPGDDGRMGVTLTVTTRRPGRFYISNHSRSMMRRATERDFVFSPGPYRSTPGRSVAEMKINGFIIHEGHAGPIEAVPEDTMTVQVSAWLTWRFEFVLDQHDLAQFRAEILALGAAALEDGHDLVAKLPKRIRMTPTERLKHVNPAESLRDVPFHLRFLVEGLVTHGIILQAEIPELVIALDRHCTRRAECAASNPAAQKKAASELQERVLTALFKEERVQHIYPKVAILAKQLRSRPPVADQYTCLVYRCFVTPTRVCLYPPEPETSNEALRLNNRHKTHFLRVTFTDEEDRIQINPKILEADLEHPADGTLARVRRALEFGLKIAGRHYVFLAYGASNAREHTAWFLAEVYNEQFSAESVRAQLGFGGIGERVIAKYAARMGLLNNRNWLPDLHDKDNHCFTDGVGICGEGVAQQAAREFGITSGTDAMPSAIQIRCGGIKGVLGVWPTLCRDADVRYRPSQVKFETNHSVMRFNLSVVRIATFRHAFLNRQFINLLDHLGVPQITFERLFGDAIKAVCGMPERFERGVPTAEDLQAARGLCTFPIKELLLAGYNKSPLFLDAVRVLETQLLHAIKWKARIELKNSAYLMGIADELGVLEEGEVFCQYEKQDEDPVVVKGPCVVMRAPSYHPGDVRLVTAVDRPELRHLKNVIVFPVRGRALPHMLSGGDLDGDDYSLIWDHRLLPDRQVVPAEFDSLSPRTVAKVSIKNVKEFFVDYIKNDILGQVSNAHLAFSDQDGPNSRVCVELARQANIAVDFAKTGIPARLAPNMRPRRWPTFMGKDLSGAAWHNYVSTKILGRLFLLVHPDPQFRPTDVTMLPDLGADERVLAYKVPKAVLDDAYRLKIDYDASVQGLMRRYRITEAEVVAGIVLRNPRRRSRREGDLKEPVEQNYRALTHETLHKADEFLSTRKKMKSVITPRQVYAIAAYQVTHGRGGEVADRLRPGWLDVLQAAELEGAAFKETGGRAGGIAPVKDAGKAIASAHPNRSGNGSTAKPSDASVIGGRTSPAHSSTWSECKVPGDDEPASLQILDMHGPEPLISFPWVFWEALCSLPNIAPQEASVLP